MRLIKYLSTDNDRAIKFIEISMRPDFEKEIQELRTKWNIDPEFLSSDSGEAKDRWLLLLEDSRMRSDVSKKLSKLRISPFWVDVVHQYLVDDSGYSYNDRGEQILRDPEGLVLEVDPDRRNFVVLRIGPRVTKRDIENVWPEIEKARKSRPVRKKSRKNFLRDYNIFRLAKEGKTTTEIQHTIEAEFGDDLDYGNIKKIVSVFYNRLKIPKDDRVCLVTFK